MKKISKKSMLSSRKFLIVCSIFVVTFGARVDAAIIVTTWNVGNGEWTNSGNWTNGQPYDGSPSDVSQAMFSPSSPSSAVSNVTVANGASAHANFIGVSYGKTLNLSLGESSSLTNTGILSVGNQVGSISAAHLNVSGPSSGSATISYNQLQLGGAATSTGNTATFSGTGLRINDVAANSIVGRQGNSHVLTVTNGVKYDGKGVWVSNTVNATSGLGNNNKLVVSGVGTEMKLVGESNSLLVASRPVTGSGTQVTSGNVVEVSGGAKLTVEGSSASLKNSVLIGNQNYRQDNYINVTGLGSMLEIGGNIQTIIGRASNTTYNNRLSVGNGGTIKTEGEIQILNGDSIAANRRNILSVDAGGTLVSNDVINNNGGLVRIANGGQLKGEDLNGVATSATLNINGSGRLEAAGSGIGSTVSINVGNGSGEAVLAIGSSGRVAAATLSLTSAIQMNALSALEISIFSFNSIDSIYLGQDSGLTLANDVSLKISLVNYVLQAGDTFQVFSGAAENVVGSFSNIVGPSLASPDLSIDWSRFNADGNWTFQVVPEPSVTVLIAGGILFLLCLRRFKRTNLDETPKKL